MQATVKPIHLSVGKKYLLNYSGIEVEGTLKDKIFINTPYFIFEFICPFRKITTKGNFIRLDVIAQID
jgi:hypothetical protein